MAKKRNTIVNVKALGNLDSYVEVNWNALTFKRYIGYLEKLLWVQNHGIFKPMILAPHGDDRGVCVFAMDEFRAFFTTTGMFVSQCDGETMEAIMPILTSCSHDVIQMFSALNECKKVKDQTKITGDILNRLVSARMTLRSEVARCMRELRELNEKEQADKK